MDTAVAHIEHRGYFGMSSVFSLSSCSSFTSAPEQPYPKAPAPSRCIFPLDSGKVTAYIPAMAKKKKTNITIDDEDEQILDEIRKLLADKDGRLSNVAIFRKATRAFLKEIAQ